MGRHHAPGQSWIGACAADQKAKKYVSKEIPLNPRKSSSVLNCNVLTKARCFDCPFPSNLDIWHAVNRLGAKAPEEYRRPVRLPV